MYEKSTLKNGLRLVSHVMPEMSSSAVGFWCGVGGRYETKAQKGIAHLMEHIAFKGTRGYSAKKIKESIEGLGGSLNAFTSEEFTCYLTKIISKHLPLVIDILSEMVLCPLILEKDLRKEKSVILEEIKMYRDLPQAYVHELLDELLWPKHPLGESLAGTLESVASIKRSQLEDFHNKFYYPGNITVSVSGNINHASILKQLSGIFTKAGPKEGVGFRKAHISQDRPKANIFNKDTQQSHLAMGYPALRHNHPDRHAISLLHVILGANMSSRLFNEVREKRALAYEIATQVKRLHDTGAFIIHAGVDNSKVVMAVATILKEMDKITKQAVSREEFSRAKEYCIGQLLMALEDTLDYMLWLGEQQMSDNRIKSPEEVLEEINRLTRDDLLRVAKAVFRKEHLNLALIGPQGDKEKKEIQGLLG